jgi:hypothetical protein
LSFKGEKTSWLKVKKGKRRKNANENDFKRKKIKENGKFYKKVGFAILKKYKRIRMGAPIKNKPTKK